MPAKGKGKVSASQRQTIAAGVVKGKTHAAIAQETGLAVTTVGRQAIDQRTKSMMAEFKQKHAKELELGFARGIRTINHYIGDGRTRKTEDPNVALRASAEMMKVITAGEQKLDVATTGGGDFTFAELIRAYLLARMAATPEELAQLP